MTRLALLLAFAAAPAFAQEVYTVRLEIEDEAAGYLAAVGEQVVIRAAYAGDPATADAPVNDAGKVALGDEAAFVTAQNQDVPLGAAVAQLPLDTVTEPMVTLSAATAALAFADNMLDCAPVEATLAQVAAEGATLSCKLLGM